MAEDGFFRCSAPASIQFGPIRVGQLECTFALILTETFPQRHRELGSVTGRELEKFCQRARWHETIVARLARSRNEARFVPASFVCDRTGAFSI
jgi:hypothetical protein